MLALKFYNQRDIRLEDIPKPEVSKGKVLIKVTDAGISQTQINEFVEGPYIINRTPLIPCQEYGGIVESVGDGVDKSLLGKQIAVMPLVTCGKCEHCTTKNEQFCDQLAYHGLLELDGGFAEYSLVDSSNIIQVEKRSMLTFIEPILVAIHAAHQCKRLYSLEDSRVLILGAGAIGIAVAAVWSSYFNADVTINDILYPRLKRAQKAGFATIEKSEISKKYDIVIDAAGMDTIVEQPAIIEGFKYLKRGGTLLNIGTYFHSIHFNPSSILLAEQSLLESITYNRKDIEILEDVIDSIDIDFNIFIENISLKDIIEEGYYRAEVDKASFTRIVVRPE